MGVNRRAAVLLGLCMAGLALWAPACRPASTTGDSIHINQIQVIGTHNSYHAGLLPGIAKLVAQSDPDSFKSLDYSHPGLGTQLDYGVRQIELDIFADSQGGRYAHPRGVGMVAKAGLPADPDPYPSGVMTKPGFKVMHVQDLDYASNCQPFVACLGIVRAWLASHPRHIPIFILVETKQDIPDQKFPWTTPEPYTPATFDALDAEIRSVFPASEIITPDDIRGHYATLNEAIRSGAWPTLPQARGRVIFLMDQKPVGPVYLQGHEGLRGRILFTNATPGDPDAAFVEENEESAEVISALVRQGYLVRTRADADTSEARTNDTRRRDEALKSGAQIVSTDYPSSEAAKWTGYSVGLPGGGPARCNPVIGAPACSAAKLEADGQD